MALGHCIPFLTCWDNCAIHAKSAIGAPRKSSAVQPSNPAAVFGADSNTPRTFSAVMDGRTTSRAS
eukprot:15466043-Alexandrium_andersonii.AAC.1